MSFYSDYVEELTNGSVLETHDGFVTYVFPDAESCYIKEIFVIRSSRNSNVATQFALSVESIAREKGCKYLLGSVVPSAKGSTGSLQVLISFGFKLFSASNDFIVFRKEL